MSAPSCPACGYKDGVELIEGTYDGGHGNRVHYSQIQGREYYCGPCNLVFVGSEAEWHRGFYGGSPFREWREHGGKKPVKKEPAM